MEVVHRQDEELGAMEQVRGMSVNNNNNLGCVQKQQIDRYVIY